jgi:hypothetical protein
MADSSALSLSGARAEAAAGKTRLAASVLHLFKADGFVPTPTSVLADFAAHEADFDGYAPLAIATWSDSVLAGVGYAIYAPTQTFPWVLAVDAVGNQIGGWYLVTAGGVLIAYAIFDPSRPVMGPDQAVITTPTDVYPAGQFA